MAKEATGLGPDPPAWPAQLEIHDQTILGGTFQSLSLSFLPWAPSPSPQLVSFIPQSRSHPQVFRKHYGSLWPPETSTHFATGCFISKVQGGQNTVVSMCNTEFIFLYYSLLIIVILSIRTTRNLPLPDLVFERGFPAMVT